MASAGRKADTKTPGSRVPRSHESPQPGFYAVPSCLDSVGMRTLVGLEGPAVLTEDAHQKDVSDLLEDVVSLSVL